MRTEKSFGATPGPEALAHAADHAHPTPRQYLPIALILAVITAVEVAVYYIGAIRPVLTPLLLVLSATKFTLVALYYMHLKFDSRLFTMLFCAGLGIAASILLVLLAVFSYHFGGA